MKNRLQDPGSPTPRQHRSEAAATLCCAPDAGAQRAAFVQNFEASFRALRAVALRIVRDAFSADDVMQDAAVIAFAKLGGFQPGSNFQAWMGQIVRFVALNHARRSRRLRTLSTEVAGVEAARSMDAHASASCASLAMGGHLPADQTHFDDRVMRALNKLTATARTCLLLRTVDGLTYAEIEQRLGIPANTIMSHVHRARLFLRQELAEREPR